MTTKGQVLIDLIQDASNLGVLHAEESFGCLPADWDVRNARDGEPDVFDLLEKLGLDSLIDAYHAAFTTTTETIADQEDEESHA